MSALGRKRQEDKKKARVEWSTEVSQKQKYTTQMIRDSHPHRHPHLTCHLRLHTICDILDNYFEGRDRLAITKWDP